MTCENDENPFYNKQFMKDIKRSFVPTKLFSTNKYGYDVTEVNFKTKNDNIISIVIKLRNNKKYEYIYMKNDNIKEITKTNSMIKNMNITEDNLENKFKRMSIDDE